jgi:hypothetical protein
VRASDPRQDTFEVACPTANTVSGDFDFDVTGILIIAHFVFQVMTEHAASILRGLIGRFMIINNYVILNPTLFTADDARHQMSIADISVSM